MGTNEFDRNGVIMSYKVGSLQTGEKYKYKVISLSNKYKNIEILLWIANYYVHKTEMKRFKNFKSKTYPLPYKYKD